MNNYQNILAKLEGFIKRHHTKILVKGILLFLVLGLLFFFIILGVEYLLWLNSNGRLVLLLAFVAVELFLLFRYILTPLFYLFRIKKGISNKRASLMIGKHFPEVDDKLYNLLELAEDDDQSELLLASIEQRSESMNPVPFAKAVDFKENLKYVKYLAIPLLLCGLLWFSGNMHSFFGSSQRIVNYDIAYEPPAPFNFKLLSKDLNVLNDKSYTILVTTEGEVRPDVVFITVEDKRLVLQEENGVFQYTLTPPMRSADFFFQGNDVTSRKYRLNVLETPAIENFELVLDYPKYTNRKREVIKSTGNAILPEGTKVTWKIQGQNTEKINLITLDTIVSFNKDENTFELSKRIYSRFSYELSTANENVDDYERLAYEFNVVRDAYPTIKVKEVRDSLNPNTSYYMGEASDDYLVNTIRLVYYPEGDDNNAQKLALGNPKSNFDQFYYTFPSGLNLEAGKNYSYYFEAVDNDAIHKGKISKSQVFTTALLDTDQLKNKELESQQAIINNMDRSLEKFKEQKETLKEINQDQKEKKALNFNDQSQIKDFLKKQQQQESMMQKFSKQLKENLNKSEKDDKMNELLKERLERQEIEAKKNEKLLEELNKIADKIDKEELSKRLEELGKKQQNSERNLEQLLELTKRYYVTEKAAQLAKDLEKLAEQQEAASEKKDALEKIEEQQELNRAFEKLAQELEELQKDNQDLKKPLDLPMDSEKKEAVKADQKDASEQLKKEQSEEASESKKQEAGQKASQKQKAAAQKMKEMSEQMEKSSAGGGGGSSIAEDADMLRQILDNLVVFSFKQESLFDSLEDADLGAPQFSGSIKKQQGLRELFEHVDDSLFSLSLRRAELSEFVNEQITEVYYNTDKALESIAENQIYQGVSYQKYVLNASNSLSDFLANILENMQQSMQSGEGEGEGEGFQLPDIIKAQGDIKEKMEGQGKEGKGKSQQGQGQGKEGEGEQSGEGKKAGEEGMAGKDGGKGESGEGKEGNAGKEGQGENEGGKKGNGGKDGQGQAENGAQGGKNGEGGQNGPSEEELKEIYEIYKSQQIIREQLEQQLQDMINAGDRKLGEKILRQMEDFENDLLENGFTQQGMNKMNNIQYELLKLENAAMKQGKKPERESNTSKSQYTNPITTKPSQLDNYRNEIEILNRQALPLRQNFKNKVKEYFKSDD